MILKSIKKRFLFGALVAFFPCVGWAQTCEPVIIIGGSCGGLFRALAPSLPGVPGTSALIDPLQLLGGHVLSTKSSVQGVGCGDLEICAGSGTTDSGYREVEIDAGLTFSRNSSIKFNLRESDIAALGAIDSVVFTMVRLDAGNGIDYRDILLNVSGSAAEQTFTLSATEFNSVTGQSSALGSTSWVGSKSVTITADSLQGSTKRLIVEYSDVWNGSGTPPTPVIFLAGGNQAPSAQVNFNAIGRPTYFRYGNLGVVNTGPPISVPTPILRLGNFTTNIGPTLGELPYDPGDF